MPPSHPLISCCFAQGCLSGLPHGAFFAAAIVAERLAPEGKKAQAVAVMVGGMTIANVAGVPVATFLSNTLNWRPAFATVGFAALRPSCVQDFGPLHIAAARHRNQRTVQVISAIPPWLVYSGVFFGQAAVYCWLSYISPIMTR